MNSLDLSIKKAELIAEKAELAQQLAVVKSRMIETLPLHVFTAREAERRRLVAAIQKCEAEISAVKSKLHIACNSTPYVKETPAPPTVDERHWLREIIDIRDGYQAFAADATRSPTMRRMASEFILTLNPIIKRGLARK